jgi:multisubunit Na+/H+ antiporter MnhG subunit
VTLLLLILFGLLLAFLFLGLGFAVHLLWIVAVIFFIAWVAGFAFRRGSGSRWYWW